MLSFFFETHQGGVSGWQGGGQESFSGEDPPHEDMGSGNKGSSHDRLQRSFILYQAQLISRCHLVSQASVSYLKEAGHILTFRVLR